MRPIDRWHALLKHDVPFSQQLPLTHFNDPTIIESCSGHLISTLSLKGVPHESERVETLFAHRQHWHQALLKLNASFGIYVTVHRHPISLPVQETADKPGFAQTLQQRYQHSVQKDPFFVNDLFITLVYKGLTTGAAGKSLSWAQSVSHRAIKQTRHQARQSAIKQLKAMRHELIGALKPFEPNILGTQDDVLGYSELLHFLSLIAGGGFGLHLPFAHHLPAIARNPAKSQKHTPYPQGHLAQYLLDTRVHFGKHIQWEDGIHPQRFADLLSLKQYVEQTPFGLLERVLQLPVHLLMTQSFLIEADEVAIERCRRLQQNMFHLRTSSDTQAHALSDLNDAISAQRVRMGYHHATVLVIDTQLSTLPATTRQVSQAFQASGLVAVHEQLGLEAAFFAQFPGNHHAIARRSLITSENFCAFNPLYNDRSGHPGDNHLGQPIVWLKTNSLAPFAFNYHAQGRPENPSKGHALLIGGNDSGKTVWLGFMDAHLARFGGRSFLFDRHRGLEIYVRACGGHYSVLAPDSANTIAMNPLQLPPTPDNIAFCKDWIITLIQSQETLTQSFEWQAPLHAAIDYLFAYYEASDRSLHRIYEYLPIDYAPKAALRAWMKPTGQYAYLFDHDQDALSMDFTQQGFDMTHLLECDQDRALKPLLMYLFYRITQSLDGRLCSIVLDEGWQYLKHPDWRSKLEDWLPTLRKRNAHIVMATQSPATIVQSPICHTLRDNSATQIFFGNPQARTCDYQQGLGLTPEEFAIVQNSTSASRHVLVKQAHESTVVRFDLNAIDDLLPVLSANEKSLRQMDRLRQQHEDWLTQFLKEVRR